MLVDLETLVLICDLFHYVPPRTPERMSVILQLCDEILAASPAMEENRKFLIDLKLHDENEMDNTVFVLNYHNIQKCSM